jgi:hypothetical protein
MYIWQQEQNSHLNSQIGKGVTAARYTRERISERSPLTDNTGRVGCMIFGLCTEQNSANTGHGSSMMLTSCRTRTRELPLRAVYVTWNRIWHVIEIVSCHCELHLSLACPCCLSVRSSASHILWIRLRHSCYVYERSRVQNLASSRPVSSYLHDWIILWH